MGDELTKKVKSFGESTRRNSTQKTTEQKLLELRLAIITSLIDEIEAEENEAKIKADKNAKKQILLEQRALIEAEEIKKLTKEEIDQQLKELE